MKIFIDESGNFQRGSDWGLVCSLALPHKELGRARREIAFVSRGWKRQDGELKGPFIEECDLASLMDILVRRDALLHAVAIHVGSEDFDDVQRHKEGQCEGMTRYLTSDHHPNLVSRVWELRNLLQRMPSQLYLQCVCQSELVITAVEETLMYFAQRRPQELAKFEWVIDAKDLQRISPQEEWWRETLGPLLESRSHTEPMRFVRDGAFNYTHFDRSYQFTKKMWYPSGQRQNITGVDIKSRHLIQ